MAAPLTIREEPAATAALDAARKKYPRTDEWWLGWSWRLVRDPLTDAIKVPGSSPQAYLMKTDDFSRYGAPPPSAFLYTFDNERLYLLEVLIPA